MFQRLGWWILGAVLIPIILFIYFMSAQIRYESEGARFFKEGRYDLAAQRYYKAYESATLFGRDRYLYLVAQCYYNAEDWQRTMDYLILLTKEYPRSDWVIVAQPALDRTLDRIEPDRLPPQLMKAQGQLARSLANLKMSYKRLTNSIKENKSGVSIEVEGEYLKYRKYYLLYKHELAKAWAAVQSGKNPDDLDGAATVPQLSPRK